MPKKTDGKELLSYQVPYNTPDVDFSPSYAFYSNPIPDIGLALGRGWYVNVPDHEGPYAADGVAVEQGYATLDSVRSVLAKGFGLRTDVRYVMWGYSGGSIASEFAAELQLQYAPELQFSGMALGGLPPNLTQVWEVSNESPFSGIIVLPLLGITNVYPEARKVLLDALKPDGPYNRTYFVSAENMSAEEGFAAFAGQDIWKYFVHGKAFLSTTTFRKILNDNIYMGYHGVPQIPIFMYKAIHDEVAPIDGVDEIVHKYCNDGVDIWYERNTVGGHVAEMTNGDGRAFEALSAFFDGTYAEEYQANGCTVKNVTVAITTSPQ